MYNIHKYNLLMIKKIDSIYYFLLINNYLKNENFQVDIHVFKNNDNFVYYILHYYNIKIMDNENLIINNFNTLYSMNWSKQYDKSDYPKNTFNA